MNIIQGNLVGTGLKIGIVVGRFNDFITSKLLSGAEDTLLRHGVDTNDIDVAWVPGAFEIPFAAKKMAETKNTMRLSHSEPLSGALRLIMIMFATKPPKASRKQEIQQECRSFLELSLRRPLSRRLNALAQKQGIKVLIAPYLP